MIQLMLGDGKFGKRKVLKKRILLLSKIKSFDPKFFNKVLRF